MFTKNIRNNSLLYLGGVISGLIIQYHYNNYKNNKQRYTKTHYNIIIKDIHDNELLESYYIDYDKKIIYFEKNLKNATVIFYTTNSKDPVHSTTISGNTFKIDFN